MEKQFGLMLQDCHVANLDNKKARTSIPAVLQEEMGDKFDLHVLQIDDESSSELFRHIFEHKGSIAPPNDTRDLLDASIVPASTVPQPVPGGSSILFGEKCTSVINDALAAKLDINIATVEGALQSDFEDHTELALAEGRFFSPLALLLSPTSPRAQRGRALLGIFEWYVGRGDSDDTARTYYYIGGFTGVALYTIRRAASSRTTSLDASLTAKYGVASLNAALRDSMFRSADVKVERYDTDVLLNDTTIAAHGIPSAFGKRDCLTDDKDRGTSTADIACEADDSIASLGRLVPSDSKRIESVLSQELEWATLPKVTDIVEEWRGLMAGGDTAISVRVDPDSDEEVPFSYSLPEVPAFACESGRWRHSSLVIDVNGFSMRGDSTCVVSGRLRLDPSYVTTLDSLNSLGVPTQATTLLSLESADGVSDANRPGQLLVLERPVPIALTLVEDPSVSVASVTQPSTTNKQVTWDVAIRVGGSKRVSLGKADLPQLVLYDQPRCILSNVQAAQLPPFALPGPADTVTHVIRYSIVASLTSASGKEEPSGYCRVGAHLALSVVKATGTALTGLRSLEIRLPMR